MYLLNAWKQSLTLFLPKHFSIFVRSSFQLFFRALLPWLEQFWWLIILDVIWFMVAGDLLDAISDYGPAIMHYYQLHGAGYYVFEAIFFLVEHILQSVNGFFLFLFLFSWLLTINSSDHKVSLSRNYKKHILYSFALFGEIGFFVWLIALVGSIIKLSFLPSLIAIFALWPAILGTWKSSFFLPPVLYIFFLLFFISEKATVKNISKSCYESFMLFLYNYPALYLLGLIEFLFSWLFDVENLENVNISAYASFSQKLIFISQSYTVHVLVFLYCCFIVTYFNRSQAMLSEIKGN